MSDNLTWTDKMPTKAGWYWVKWSNGSKTLWSFDASDDFDAQYLRAKKAELFYGPLQPPEDNE